MPVIQRLHSLSLTLTLILLGWVVSPPKAEAQRATFCQLTSQQIAQKDQLRQRGTNGDRDSLNQYRRLVRQHAEQLENCREETWPQNQAVWLRLYPCDARPGEMERVLDRIVSKGYNQVYIEAFGAGQVLLPSGDNPTVWPAVLRESGYERRDLLAEAIAKGNERGLKVYAWMFSMNFGYSYLQRPGASQALAYNGYGQTSLEAARSASLNADGSFHSEEVFVDPYSAQARNDYATLVQAVLRREPDGVLFDYIRYLRGSGASSVASRVQDLWIYGPSAQQAFMQRAMNQSGQDAMHRYLQNGHISLQDAVDLQARYPQEPQPLWQSLNPDPAFTLAPPEERRPYLQQGLWRLAIAHAYQGVIDFLTQAAVPAQQRGIPAGAVFFPEGNQFVGQNGLDSRLQPWDRFPQSLEWHPMSYATCGNTTCIVSQIQRVVAQASSPSQVRPVLAGTWGQSMSGRPSLESQMLAIRQATPQLQTVSHFAFSWQEPQMDRERKFCQLR